MGRRRLRFSSVDIIVCNRSTFLLLLIGAQPLLVHEVMHTSASLWDTPARNMGRHCREWPAGKTDSEIKLFVQENSNSQDLIVYTDGSVTKDQSGWGFIVKHGATTIHEDNAACTISTSSLTMEVETVTHSLRWIASRSDSRTTHAIIFVFSMSLL